MKKNKIFVACDTTNISKIIKIIDETRNPKLKIGYKFGLEFLNSKNGRNFISKLKNKIIFADLKLHDIPNTVYKALKNLLHQKVWMTNIHLLGGEEMIQAAREAKEHTKSEALLIGVTVLTSLDGNNIKNMGFNIQIPELVK
jgi:orotidine-5'-phosphate decarboxylase